MAKLLSFAALLFVSLMVVVSYSDVVAGEQEMAVVDMDAVTGPDRVEVSTFFWGYKPYYPWWPVDYCGWDFYTTGIWQITFAGAVCNNAYGTRLANFARTRMTSRSFSGLMMGVSPTTFPVLCARSGKAGQVVYTVQLRVPNTPRGRQILQGLRSTNGGLARTMYNAGSVFSIGGLPKGYKFFKSEWISSYWCNGCPIRPGSTGFPITGGASNAAFNCSTPVPSGGNCSFTCGTNGGEPVEGTAPVCRANKWTFAWEDGPGGPPACAAAQTGCPIRPDSTGFPITGGASNAAFNCSTPVPSDGNCSFTCGTNGGEPVEGTAPVCRTDVSPPAWENGPGGPPACAAACLSFEDACGAGCGATLTLPICAEAPTCLDGAGAVQTCNPGVYTCGVNGELCTTCNAFCQAAHSFDCFTMSGLSSPSQCGCFSADSSVRLANGEVKRMYQLQPGDKVLAADPATGAPTYTTFIQHTHAVSKDMATFLAITTSSNTTIKLTPGHLLLRAKRTPSETQVSTVADKMAKVLTESAFPASVDGHQVEVVAARMIKEGDTLFRAADPAASRRMAALDEMSVEAGSAEVAFQAEVVSNLQVVREQGYYNPHTNVANIVVDGVLASCFNEGSSTYGNIFTYLPDKMAGIVSHWVGDRVSLVTLLRHLYAYVPEWSVPRVAAIEPQGGWSHLPPMQRWLFVGEGLVAAAKKMLGFPPHVPSSNAMAPVGIAAPSHVAATAAAATVAAVLLGSVMIINVKRGIAKE